MSIDEMSRAEVVQKFGRKSGDTGSPEVQVALMTQRIEKLVKHFASHVNDQHSRRGMFTLINSRKTLLQYLKSEDIDRYRKTINALNLRK